MNPTWWITFLFGAASGAVIVGAWLRAMQVPREGEAYMRGVQDARDGLAPRPPLDHPSRRRTDHGTSDVTAALGGLLCAAVVLWLAGGVW